MRASQPNEFKSGPSTLSGAGTPARPGRNTPLLPGGPWRLARGWRLRRFFAQIVFGALGAACAAQAVIGSVELVRDQIPAVSAAVLIPREIQNFGDQIPRRVEIAAANPALPSTIQVLRNAAAPRDVVTLAALVGLLLALRARGARSSALARIARRPVVDSAFLYEVQSRSNSVVVKCVVANSEVQMVLGRGASPSDVLVLLDSDHAVAVHERGNSENAILLTRDLAPFCFTEEERETAQAVLRMRGSRTTLTAG